MFKKNGNFKKMKSERWFIDSRGLIEISDFKK